MQHFNQNLINEDLDFILKSDLPWDSFSGKSVLITGASGMLPAYMVETLLRLNAGKGAGAKVFALVRNLEKAKRRFSAYEGDPNLCFLHQDVCEKIPTSTKFDFIIHGASNASPSFYGKEPVGTLKANTLGTFHLLESARETGCESFLFLSSGEVYGRVPENLIPTREEDYGYLDPLEVRSCYGESKRMGENMCVSFFHQYGVPAKIVRPSHTYGPGLDLQDVRVFSEFVKNVVERKDLVLKSEGLASRCFCYLADATQAFFTVLLKGENGRAYNVSDPSGEITIRDLADKVAGLFPELHLKVIHDYRPREKGYLQSKTERIFPDTSKIRQLGWSPAFSIEEGFKRTIGVYL